jgi:hypothetical protein
MRMNRSIGSGFAVMALMFSAVAGAQERGNSPPAPKPVPRMNQAQPGVQPAAQRPAPRDIAERLSKAMGQDQQLVSIQRDIQKQVLDGSATASSIKPLVDRFYDRIADVGKAAKLPPVKRPATPITRGDVTISAVAAGSGGSLPAGAIAVTSAGIKFPSGEAPKETYTFQFDSLSGKESLRDGCAQAQVASGNGLMTLGVYNGDGKVYAGMPEDCGSATEWRYGIVKLPPGGQSYKAKVHLQLKEAKSFVFASVPKCEIDSDTPLLDDDYNFVGNWLWENIASSDTQTVDGATAQAKSWIGIGWSGPFDKKVFQLCTILDQWPAGTNPADAKTGAMTVVCEGDASVDFQVGPMVKVRSYAHSYAYGCPAMAGATAGIQFGKMVVELVRQ